MDWVYAHFRRFFGVNLFGKRRELFWVRFPCATSALSALKDMCESGKLNVQVGQTFPFSSEGLQEAFAVQMSRRVQGKLVINIVDHV